ncbi:DNA-binding protein with HTH domain protein [Rheinheimera sp. A13L]|uniref:helix-turn-helix domain-containing protein n=1 Tax=Rheinheimera sp. A13L TaxID=506534 RepID=UPI0002124E25|nr:helix-turn-helix transcriptional regulator [Rheinheimera sp. A13L]EGM79774.1 DNA-binding protein with HTH domain protein [Rheinheimera sp. A13L]
MSFFEQTLAELDQVETLIQLERYLIQFSELPHIDWCCFIVHRDSTSYIGSVPDGVKQKLTLAALKQVCQHCYKPSWSGSEKLTKVTLPQASLLIPIVTSRPDHACLILGFTNQNVEPKFAEKLGWFWQIVGTYVYDTYRRLNETEPGVEVRLTPREIECIHWAAHGKTSWEISRILSITERTVNFHLTNSMQKTGSSNRQQLIHNYMNSM